jgi:hypothetical protein
VSANPILSDSPGKPPPSTFNYRWDTSLAEDQMHISTYVLGRPSARIDIPLQGVQTQIQSGSVPDTYLRAWLLAVTVTVLILGLGGPDLMTTPADTEFSESRFGAAYIGALILVVLTLSLAAFLYPAPLDFVGFLHSGGNVAFDVVRVGMESNQFDAFIESVRKRVSALQALGGTSGLVASGDAPQSSPTQERA